jgi:hypothetical protein
MEQKYGWAYLSNARFWHYFVGGRSLCRRWAIFKIAGFEVGNDSSPDNCKVCLKILLKNKKNV